MFRPFPSARYVRRTLRIEACSNASVPQFYCEDHAKIGEAYARFAFCKDTDTLKAAVKRLARLKEYIVEKV